MDDIVKAALAKWPNVPHAYGWLGLDARGDWYLRDEAAQAAGKFPAVKGSRIEHRKLLEFIVRNYEADERGCWFFQNGPQRVFVELEAAPFVWRVQGTSVEAADRRVIAAREAWLDDDGRLFVACDAGFGLVHSLDTGLAALAIEAGTWTVHDAAFAGLPARFGYVLSPHALSVRDA